MFRDWKWARIAPVALLAAGVVWGGLAWAKKPPKPPPPLPSVRFQVVVLDELPGGRGANPKGLNGHGDVVGNGRRAVDDKQVGILWTSDGVAEDLNGRLQTEGLIDEDVNWRVEWAHDVNDSGQIVGQLRWTGSGSEPSAAFCYTPGADGAPGELIVLDDGGYGGSVGVSINTNGEIAGSLGDGTRAAAWLSDGQGGLTLLDLSLLEGSPTSVCAINDAGQVAGNGYDAGGNDHAWRYTPGDGIVDLGTLARRDALWSHADDMNDLGQVVGSAFAQKGYIPTRAFRYTDGVGMENLGKLKDALSSYARGVHNLGYVVGESWGGFLYTDEHGMVRLDELVDPASMPEGNSFDRVGEINDSGLIIGTLIDPQQQKQAVLLIPDALPADW